MENSVNQDSLNDLFSKQFHLPYQFMVPDALANAYYTYEKLETMAKWILEKVNFKPLVAVICGSGLGEIANLVENKHVLQYSEIPDFPRSTVHGHKGNLVFGNLSSLPVVCMQGRFHPFEGYCLALCTMPIKIFKLLGVKLLVLTNAAGGVNKSYNVGDLMIIKDHLSFPLLSLSHPLIGQNDERFGPRFTPVNNIYDKRFRELLRHCGNELGIQLHEGVYGTIGGPTYETVADTLYCQAAGMDCVGMSTSHEAVVARYCNMHVLGLSIVTDMCIDKYDAEEYPDHDEIVKIANLKAKDAERLVALFLKKINENKTLLE